MNIVDAVAEYAPAQSDEWSRARQDAVLAAILGGNATGTADTSVVIPLQARAERPRRRRHATLISAGAAALTAAASAIVAITFSGGSTLPTVSAGAPFDPPPGLSDKAMPADKFMMQVTQEVVLGNDGQPDPTARDNGNYTIYVSADGHLLSYGSDHSCTYARDRSVGLSSPDEAFLAGLPTDIAKLNDYLRSHVEGSSSLDEAVFVAVGDVLRQGSGLASPKLRAAMLGVLSRTPGVIVHQGVQDYLGRTAIRADFVNQAIRPGWVQSLYFDPTDFSLLETREGANGAPTSFDGPSPAYTAPAPADAVDPDQLTGQAWIGAVKQEQIVDSLPDHSSCN